jgi:hypothetical protein
MFTANILLIIVYVASWMVRVATMWRGKWQIGIYFCHYANKVHLIIFNLVFIDFIWLAPRTLLHSRDLPVGDYIVNWAIVFLIVADLCLILAHLLDDRIWSKAYMHYSKKGISRLINPHKTNAIAPVNSKNNWKRGNYKIIINRSEEEVEVVGDNQTKQINYKKTYFEIDFNVHLMDYTAGRMDERYSSSFLSLLSRLLVFVPWLRFPLLSVVIMSTQYCPSLGLVVLLGFEMIRMYASIYAYLKYKYLKNIICLLMELVSALFLSLFYINALLISPKRFDEIIMDFYQDAGIWIVIASCVAEYLLLITYIAVAAYEFFKNRKMMKKMNVKPEKYSVIKYDIIRPTSGPISHSDITEQGLNSYKNISNQNTSLATIESGPVPSSLLLLSQKTIRSSLQPRRFSQSTLKPNKISTKPEIMLRGHLKILHSIK